MEASPNHIHGPAPPTADTTPVASSAPRAARYDQQPLYTVVQMTIVVADKSGAGALRIPMRRFGDKLRRCAQPELLTHIRRKRAHAVGAAPESARRGGAPAMRHLAVLMSWCDPHKKHGDARRSSVAGVRCKAATPRASLTILPAAAATVVESWLNQGIKRFARVSPTHLRPHTRPRVQVLRHQLSRTWTYSVGEKLRTVSTPVRRYRRQRINRGSRPASTG